MGECSLKCRFLSLGQKKIFIFLSRKEDCPKLPGGASSDVHFKGPKDMNGYIMLSFSFFFFIFWQTWGLNVRASRLLYALSHTSNPFASGYFGDRVWLFTQAAWTTILF
jgi:hypothetical protein